jgi:hypothetical protein
MTTNGLKEEAGLVHRTFQEFETLDKKIRSSFWLTHPPSDLPPETEANTKNLNVYLQMLYLDDSVRQSVLFADFLSINWDGKDIGFMYSFIGFMKMLLVARVPDFMPEPPRIEKDAFVAEGMFYIFT